MARRFIRILALALVAAAALVTVPFSSAPAHADGWGDSCNPSTYGGARYRIVTATKAPAITHIGTYGVGPGVSRTMTRTVTKQTVISAAVNYSSGGTVEASLPGKILGKASATVNLSLQASGSRTSSSNSTVTETVTNRTGSNVQFVFYKGVTKAYGKFRKLTCTYYYFPGKNYGYYRIRIKDGGWRSYAVPGDGAVRCGAGTTGLGALARAALRIGCPA